MPRRALYHLRWSLEKQGYEIQIRHDSTSCRLLPESSAWFDWLEEIGSFAFSSREGIHCTLLKERVQRGTYWYAYRTQQGRTRKRYVGRTADLSLARLEQISAFLANNSPASRMKRLQNADQADSLLPSVSSPPLRLQESMAPLLFSKLQPPRLPALLIQRVRLFSAPINVVKRMQA